MEREVVGVRNSFDAEVGLFLGSSVGSSEDGYGVQTGEQRKGNEWGMG